MSMSSVRAAGMALAFLLALAGCQTTAEREEPTEPPPAAEPEPRQPAEPAPQPEPAEPRWSTTSAGDPIPPGASEPLSTIFYFDFDKAVIKPRARTLLREHAEYLQEHPDVDVVLEGHADERGTREYNLALGERRAGAVEDYLATLGVARSQMDVVSYGEERPVDPGHNEEAWAKNRRVEIVYR